MKKFKLILLCSIMTMGLLTFTACGMGNNNTNDGTEPPYEDDVNNGNNGANGTDNNNIGDDIQNGMDNMGDDIQNGIDNVEDGIQNGIDNVQDGIDNGIDNMQDGTENGTENGTGNGTQNGVDDMDNRTSRLEQAGQNFMDSVKEAGDAIRNGIRQITATDKDTN